MRILELLDRTANVAILPSVLCAAAGAALTSLPAIWVGTTGIFCCAILKLGAKCAT